MAGEYQENQITGVIESVTQKKSQNGKDFWETRVNGNEYTIWDSFLAQQADAYCQGSVSVRANVRAKVDASGRVSKFWSIRDLEPISPGETASGGYPMSTPQSTASVTAGQTTAVLPEGRDIGNRYGLLELSIRALAGNDTISDPNTVIGYAEVLERFLLGKK